MYDIPMLQMKEKFNALEGRVSGLESGGYENPNPAQVSSFSTSLPPFVAMIDC